MSGARELVLKSIRAASGAADSAASVHAAYELLPRTYMQRETKSWEECLQLMMERLREYDAEVIECAPQQLPETIAQQLAGCGRKTFAAPGGLPAAWMAAGFDWRVDNNLVIDTIETVDGVVTASFCGVADSGTIVLHHGATEGRRVLTLLPDWHLCVLRASDVVETLPEYFARVAEPPALVTFISGPSATADIEMTRIKGVHGPRLLVVVLVRDEQPAV